MRTSLQVAVTILVLYAAANILYFLKSANGIDLLPGHHGAMFPLGDRLWQMSRR